MSRGNGDVNQEALVSTIVTVRWGTGSPQANVPVWGMAYELPVLSQANKVLTGGTLLLGGDPIGHTPGEAYSVEEYKAIASAQEQLQPSARRPNETNRGDQFSISPKKAKIPLISTLSAARIQGGVLAERGQETKSYKHY